MLKIYTLKNEAKIEVYTFIDKQLRELPKNKDGSLNEFADGYSDNDVDALRHAYVSGVYTMEYSKGTADMLGRLQELFVPDSSTANPGSENMDLWNNAVGRKYGEKSESRKELFNLLLKALKNGELIIDPEDKRKYKGEGLIKKKLKSLVIKVEESKTGANISFYDVYQKKMMTKDKFLELIKAGEYPQYSYKVVDGNEIPISKRDGLRFNNLG